MAGRMHDGKIEVDEVLSLSRTRAPSSRMVGQAHWPWSSRGTDNAIWRLGVDLVVDSPASNGRRGSRRKPRGCPGSPAPSPSPAPEPAAVGGTGPWGSVSMGPARRSSRGTCFAGRWLDPVDFAAEPSPTSCGLSRRCPPRRPPSGEPGSGPCGADHATLGAIEYARTSINTRQAREGLEQALLCPPMRTSRCGTRRRRGKLLVWTATVRIVDRAPLAQEILLLTCRSSWSPLFTEESRRSISDAAGVDDATLARSRGQPSTQACGALPHRLVHLSLIVERSWHKLRALGVEPSKAVVGVTRLKALRSLTSLSSISMFQALSATSTTRNRSGEQQGFDRRHPKVLQPLADAEHRKL